MDGIRAVDYLLTRDDVDGKHLAITGTSGGGFQALWIGALDPRIAAVLPSCFPTALPMRMANRIFEDPDSDPEQDPPGLVSEGIDHPGLLLLAYPRPVHVSAAVLDFFPIEGTRKTMREVAALYRRFGHGDRVALSEGYHRHQYSAENQARAFAFLDRAFGRPAHRGLGEAKTLAPEVLQCTPSGQVREDLGGRSLLEVIRDDTRTHPPAARTSAELYRGEGYPGIRDWPVVAFAGTAPRDAIAWEASGTDRVGTAVIDRYRLHHAGGLVVPLVHVRREGAPRGNVLLRLSLEGKIRAGDWPEVTSLLADGHEVVSFDPRGLGETRMRYRATSIDDPALAPSDEEAAYASPLSGVLANHVYNAQLLRAAVPLRDDRGRRGRLPLRSGAPRRAGGRDRGAGGGAPPGSRGRGGPAGRRPRRALRRRAVLLVERGGRDAPRDLAHPLPRARGRVAPPRRPVGRSESVRATAVRLGWGAAAVLLSAAAPWGGTGLDPAWGLTWLAAWPVLAFGLRASAPAAAAAAFAAWACGGLNLWHDYRAILGVPLPVALAAVALPRPASPFTSGGRPL